MKKEKLPEIIETIILGSLLLSFTEEFSKPVNNELDFILNRLETHFGKFLGDEIRFIISDFYGAELTNTDCGIVSSAYDYNVLKGQGFRVGEIDIYLDEELEQEDQFKPVLILKLKEEVM